MKNLLKVCPFQIKRLQTDNGTEYTYKFYKRYADIEKVHPLENFCEKNGIVQKLIPPGIKELQGLVERSHRQDDQELFSRIEPDEIDEFNDYLKEYYIERNEGRRFKKHDWKTPNEWLKDYKNMQMALEFGHNYKFRNRDESLLPKLKIVELPKPNEQVSSSKIDKRLNSCKEKGKRVDKKDLKQAA